MPATKKTFIVERANPNGGVDEIEVKADRAEQDADSTRVTFYDGDDAVASFINIQGWYPTT